jgi:hypothetical protein
MPGYHLKPPLNFEMADDLAVLSSVNVLFPSPCLKNLSGGGPHMALLLASMLEERGERSRFQLSLRSNCTGVFTIEAVQ